jgi:hypothetical protein
LSTFNLERSPRERLYWLMDLVLADEIDTQGFATEFGRTYVDIEESALTAEEHRTFAKVLKVAKLYAPVNPQVADTYPARRSDADVRQAVVAAKTALPRTRS